MIDMTDEQIANPAYNDSFLFYDVPGWDKYGLAVANWSDDGISQNQTIRHLVRVMGRNLWALMWHNDVRKDAPPSPNTIDRIHKLCIRARSILAARSIPENEKLMEPIHTNPAPEQFILFPTPYFTVRNGWLREYCGYMLTALSEAMQHTENATPIEISENFSKDIGQYISRVYRLMATELLQVPPAEAKAANFTLTDTQLKAYAPSQWFSRTEMTDTVPDLLKWPTEDQLKPIKGIAIADLPPMGRWRNYSTGQAPDEKAQPGGSWPDKPNT